ncbi:hypothetical protein H9635_07740 [Solibacillus sp. A46]|uniref:DUF2922 domain-containing protein n=2 Tax=Solibacillus faecavium TaxID=2762221 RepID=A0ABR8XXG1_9BACL|nr:hypothetical protein [Solibacillus faecavium]
MTYKIFMKDKFDGSLEEVDEEIYHSKDDAQDALSEVINNFMTGAEVLELSGRSSLDSNDYEFIIKKI